MDTRACVPPMRKISTVSGRRSHDARMGLENGSMFEKELVFPLSSNGFFSLPIPVEAHSPFVQCIAWASATSSESEGESDRILNVVATGGTDKVRGPVVLSRLSWSKSFL